MRRASAQALYSNRTARSLHNLPARRRSLRFNHEIFIGALLAIFLLCSIGLFLCWFIVFRDTAAISSGGGLKPILSRIAFGSSSSHDYSSQPVWVHGIIPSEPHAWIWLGNMAYLDEARVDCEASPKHRQCNCSADWLRQPPNFCMTGDLDHAASKMQTQLANPDYAQFLAFMCPGHREKGLFPPAGSDLSVCPRSIFGTYGDQDYGWRHGDKRLPRKDEVKQIFLDAIGEKQDSPRRSKGRGIEWKYTLNQGKSGDEIDLILLDTRYYRDPLPCHGRTEYCENLAKNKASFKHYPWCNDFLEGNNGDDCCDKDDRGINGSFCEILGSDQRTWLENTLSQSPSLLKLLVSSSVVLDADEQYAGAHFSGNGWNCYRGAQLNLLELITKASGCVIILSGGLDESRIRVLKPGYHSRYGELTLSNPLYEVIPSGLTKKSHEASKNNEGPAFGVVEIDGGVVKLQIRDGMTSAIKLESTFSLSSCYSAALK